ncbi:hypothetical protein NHX12_014251, partial [Muraenolepis orangiensis]
MSDEKKNDPLDATMKYVNKPDDIDPLQSRRSQDSEPRRNQDSEPRRYQDSEPRRYQESEPRRSQDSEPMRYQDSEPRRYQDSEPRRYQDSEPRRNQDSEPRRYQDSEPRRYQDSEPRRYQDLEPRRYQDSEPRRYQDSEPRRYYGLKNQGSTNYLNCMLQVLFMTPQFRQAVQSSCGQTPLNDELRVVFEELKTGSPSTWHVIQELGIKKVWEQRDAAEYFEKILTLASPQASQFFRGRLTHRTTCSRCHRTVDTDGPFWTLNLAIENTFKGGYNVTDGLKALFRQSRLTGDNQLYCDHCDDKADATMECKLGEHPEVLVLLLKRFVLDYHCMEYVKNDSLGLSYELYATVDHYGNLRGGHYTATIRPPDSSQGRWYKFNDSSVEELATFTPEKSSSAFLLLYRRNQCRFTEEDVNHKAGGSAQRKRSYPFDVSVQEKVSKGEKANAIFTPEKSSSAFLLHDRRNQPLLTKSPQCFEEGKGGRPNRPRPGEVPGSGEGGKKTGDTEVSTNETKSHSEAGGSTHKAEGSAQKAGGSAHKAGGSAHKAEGSAHKAGGSAHKAEGSAHKAGGSAPQVCVPEGGGDQRKRSLPLDVKENKKATFTPEKSSSAFLLHDRRNPPLLTKSPQCFEEGKGGRPNRPRPGEVPGSGEGGKKTGDTEVSTNETKSHSEAGGSTHKAEGSAQKAGGSAHKAGGSAHKAEGSAHKAGGSAHKAEGSAHKAGGSAPQVCVPEGGGDQRKRSLPLDVKENKKATFTPEKSSSAFLLHDRRNPPLLTKSPQCFEEGKGGRPNRPRPGEVPGSGEGGKKTGDTEVSTNETKSHSEAGGSTHKAEGSAQKAGGSAHKAGGSAHKAEGSAHKAGGSAHKAGGSAHKAGGSAPQVCVPEGGGDQRKRSLPLDVKENKKAIFTPEKSSSAFHLHDRRNQPLLTKSPQCFEEGKGGRPTRPRPGEVPGSGEGGKKTGDTEVSTNETKSHSEAGGSTHKAEGSAHKAGGSAHKAGGSVCVPEGGGDQRKRSLPLDVKENKKATFTPEKSSSAFLLHDRRNP